MNIVGIIILSLGYIAMMCIFTFAFAATGIIDDCIYPIEQKWIKVVIKLLCSLFWPITVVTALIISFYSYLEDS